MQPQSYYQEVPYQVPVIYYCGVPGTRYHVLPGTVGIYLTVIILVGTRYLVPGNCTLQYVPGGGYRYQVVYIN